MSPTNPAGQIPPQVIYMIRHGEKPNSPTVPPLGIDEVGRPDFHSLIPTGWARAGGLAALFGPKNRRPGIQRPDRLYSPSYGSTPHTQAHRTHQTIAKLSERLNTPIVSSYPVGQEAQAIAEVMSSGPGTVLICWEHVGIASLAKALPLAPGTTIPVWPGNRFDVIYRFDSQTLPNGSVQYGLTQLTQRILSGDLKTPITTGPSSGITVA